ncbi:hypothetical protein HYV89_04005 [Candidatus Woesearchaeota archaeon]|nr:hypothetical protein [Candidatus Woesearchaeota archaeon]
MKNPKIMTTGELIELADEIKKGMTMRVMRDIDKLERTSIKISKMKNKSTITKKEAIMIADWIKSGMSIEVLNDLKELKSARFRPLRAA